MKQKYSFYLWADAEKKIGLGHLSRLRFILEELVRRKLRVKIFTKHNELSNSLLKKNVYFLKKNISYYVKKNKLPSEFKKEEKKIKIIFIDSYEVKKVFFDKLRKNNFKIVYFNDFKENINADLNICLGSSVKNKKYISGFNYIPLANEYSKAKINSLNKKTVLITFGAIDHYNLSLKLVKILLNYKINIIVVIGKYYSKNIYQNLVRKKLKKVKIAYHPKSLFKLLKKSDSVICAGGFTVFESLSLGIPTLCLELWKNQSVNLTSLKNKKLIKSINYNDDKPFKLQQKYLDVLFDQKYRTNISNRTKKIISGNGAANILKETIKRLS